MKKIKTTKLLSILLGLMIGLVACSDDDDDQEPNYDADPGTFTMTISGEMSQTLTGNAVFVTSTDPDTGEMVFAMSMASDSSVVLFAKRGDRPSTGSYSVWNMEDGEFDDGDIPIDQFYIWLSIQDDPMIYIFSRSGTVQINGSNAERVYGTFTYQGEGFTLNDPEDTFTVTASGAFHATAGPM